MSQEIELKLALGPEGPDALRHHPLLADIAPGVTFLGNTYFDTPAGELEMARMALRLRRLDGRLLQTVKTRGEGGGGLSQRGEWEWQVPGPGLDLAGPDGAASGRTGPGRAGTPGGAIYHGFSSRDLAAGAPRGKDRAGALDEGEITAGDGRVAIRELELELKAGETATLWSLAEALAARVALRPSDTSKAARGGALLSGEWRLPEGGSPQAWLHRAVVALDAHADSGRAECHAAAREAFRRLAAQGDTVTRDAAGTLADALADDAWLTPPLGRCLLQLSHHLSGREALA